jgi:hypothetical protein
MAMHWYSRGRNRLHLEKAIPAENRTRGDRAGRPMVAKYVPVSIVDVSPEVGVGRIHRGIHDLFEPKAALPKYRFQAPQSGSRLLTGRAPAPLVPDKTRDPHSIAVSHCE